MKQYADTPAAIALGLFFLGGVFYVAQLLLMTESWLAQNLDAVNAPQDKNWS